VGSTPASGSKDGKILQIMAEFKRSRLKRETNEEITKKTVFLGVLTVLFFVLIIVFGLPLMVKFSVLLGELKKGKQGDTIVKELPPSAPRLVVPFEATNSATLDIEGFAEIGTEVDLLKNDVLYKTSEVDEEGSFLFEDVELEMGNNFLYALARSEKGGSSELSKEVNIVYDNEKPSLTMVNPSEDELTVDYADFDVVGISEANVSVLVGGKVAMVDDEGRFKLKVQLQTGKNEIEIIVKDLAGNETRKKINITYDF